MFLKDFITFLTENAKSFVHRWTQIFTVMSVLRPNNKIQKSVYICANLWISIVWPDYRQKKAQSAKWFSPLCTLHFDSAFRTPGSTLRSALDGQPQGLPQLCTLFS